MKNLILLVALLITVSCIKNQDHLEINSFSTIEVIEEGQAGFENDSYIDINSPEFLEQDCKEEIDYQYPDESAIELLEMKQECEGAFND